jgi:hypothetical protein
MHEQHMLFGFMMDQQVGLKLLETLADLDAVLALGLTQSGDLAAQVPVILDEKFEDIHGTSFLFLMSGSLNEREGGAAVPCKQRKSRRLGASGIDSLFPVLERSESSEHVADLHLVGTDTPQGLRVVLEPGLIGFPPVPVHPPVYVGVQIVFSPCALQFFQGSSASF